jgi:hypothetical protein
MPSYSAGRLHAASFRDYGSLLLQVNTFGFHSSEKKLRISERVVLNCCNKGTSKRIIFKVEESLDPAEGRSIFFRDIAKYLV